MKIALKHLLLLVWLLPLSAVAAGKPLVVASIQPLALLAQEFYGTQVEVRTLLPLQDPDQVSNFTPQQLALLHRADLLLWLGAGAEPYLQPFLGQRQRPALALLQQPGVVPIRDGEQDTSLNPHLWLDPVLMGKLLPGMARAGAQLGLPAAPLQQRAEQMQQQLASLLAQARQQVRPLASVSWLSYHDPWRYFQAALGLAPPLTVEEQLGAETGSQHFLQLAQAMRQQQVRCALLEPEARKAMMEKLCQAPTCQLRALDPLGRDAPAGSYSQWWSGLVSAVGQCLAGQ